MWTDSHVTTHSPALPRRLPEPEPSSWCEQNSQTGRSYKHSYIIKQSEIEKALHFTKCERRECVLSERRECVLSDGRQCVLSEGRQCVLSEGRQCVLSEGRECVLGDLA